MRISSQVKQRLGSNQIRQNYKDVDAVASSQTSQSDFYLELNIIALSGDIDTVGDYGDLTEKCQLVLR